MADGDVKAIKVILDEKALDEIGDEPVRNFFKADENGERFVLNGESVDGFGLENIGKGRKTIEEERNARKAAEGQLKAWQKLGVDAPEAAKLIERGRAVADGKFTDADGAKAAQEDLKAQLTSKFDEEIQAREARIEKLMGHVDTSFRRNVAAEALARRGANVDLMLPHVIGHLKAVETDDGFETKVVDDKGQPKISRKTDNHGDMSVDELLDGMATDPKYAGAFPIGNAEGGGTKPGSTGGASPPGGDGRVTVRQSQLKDPDVMEAAFAKADELGIKHTDIVVEDG